MRQVRVAFEEKMPTTARDLREAPSHILHQILLELLTPTTDIGVNILALSFENPDGSTKVFLQCMRDFYVNAYDQMMEAVYASAGPLHPRPKITPPEKLVRDKDIYDTINPFLTYLIKLVHNVNVRGAGDFAVLSARTNNAYKYNVNPTTNNVTSGQGKIPNDMVLFRPENLFVKSIIANCLLLTHQSAEDVRGSKSNDPMVNLPQWSIRGFSVGSISEMLKAPGFHRELGNLWKIPTG